MLDFSWSELLVVILVAVVVIGPKQIPDILYHLGRFTRRIQYMRFALSKQFDDFMEQTEMKQIDRDVRAISTDYFNEADADKDLDDELSKDKDKPAPTDQQPSKPDAA